MKKPFVSIIIVNWNGVELLKDCLKSLEKVAYQNKEIVLVDNASADTSVSFVQKHYPKIKIIKNRENFGFAKGNNIGYAKAKGDAIMILNTDTMVEKNLVTELVKVLYSSPNIGAVQPKVIMYPQTNKIDSIGSFFSLSGILYHFGREKNPKNKLFNIPLEIYAAKGVCILFKKEALKKTGFFDEDYFAYFEETDLCHRILLAGYKIMYTPTTAIFHKGGASSTKLASSFIFYHSYKNRIYTYVKNLSIEYLLIVLPITLLIYLGVISTYILTGHFSLAWAVVKSIFWNIFHLPQILKKRSIIQRQIRRVKDRDFLPQVTKHVRISYYYYMLVNHIFAKGMHQYDDSL